MSRAGAQWMLAATLLAAPFQADTATASLGSVTAVRHWSEEEMTRVAVETTGEFQFRSGRVHNPERIYLDLLHTQPRLEKNGGPYTEEIGDKLLTRIRAAELRAGVTRVVLDLANPAASAQPTVVPPNQLLIELRPGNLPAAAAMLAVSTAPAIAKTLEAAEASAAPPLAQPTSATPQNLSLVVGTGAAIDCPEGVIRVSTSNPEVVDAVIASDGEVLFHSKALGQATLMVWSKAGERRIYQVTVEPNLQPLRGLLRETFPAEQIDLRAARDSLALVGHASSQAVADRALALIAASVKGAINNLEVDAAPPARQILLKVRFAELNRKAAADFGVNLLSTGALNTIGGTSTQQFSPPGMADLTGGIPKSNSASATFKLSDLLNIFAFRPDLNLGAFLRDLQSRGLLEILAEPNVVASNGKEASFLAGGEFPIPVVQAGSSAGAITVQYREYGIRLTFLPQLTPNRTIRLHVKPEVSTIDPANGITVSGFQIPALSTRRVETDIELFEGQSFAIAGLLDQRVQQQLERMPGFASIPLLGALFRSHSVSKDKTELVVIVTPEATGPLEGTPPIPPMPVPFLGPAEPPPPGSGPLDDWTH